MNDEKYYTNQRNDINSFIPKDIKLKKILEIGCGTGNFKNNIVFCEEYWGVEPVPEVAGIAKKKLSKVLIGKFDDIYDKLPNNYFDLIICNDVIEHLEDHELFLERIKLKMNHNKSSLIGSVPNVRYHKNLCNLIFLRDWKYKEEGTLDKTHLRFFTIKSLKNVFKKNDFQIDLVKLINGKEISTNKLKLVVKYLLFSLISLISIGLFNDVSYLQIGFRVTLDNQD